MYDCDAIVRLRLQAGNEIPAKEICRKVCSSALEGDRRVE